MYASIVYALYLKSTWNNYILGSVEELQQKRKRAIMICSKTCIFAYTFRLERVSEVISIRKYKLEKVPTGCLHSTSSELDTHPSPPAAAAIMPLMLMFSATHFSGMSRGELRQHTQGRASCAVARRHGRAPAASCVGTRKHPQGGEHPRRTALARVSIRDVRANCAGVCRHG